MHHRNRDYVTLERNDRPATFFDRFPVHRKLISVNKRYTGRTNPSFNMRHDWNSLLESEVPQMTTRTKERFPQAAILADYLRDFARSQEDAGRILYGVAVAKIERAQSGIGFQLEVLDRRSSPAVSATLECEVVISCTGMSKATIPPNLDVPGAIGYDELPERAEDTEATFENKSVVIFGTGNAAMETSKALMPYVQFVHVFGGSKHKEHPITSCAQRHSIWLVCKSVLTAFAAGVQGRAATLALSARPTRRSLTRTTSSLSTVVWRTAAPGSMPRQRRRGVAARASGSSA